MSNLDLWRRVSVSNPDDTKSARGNQGSFTAIDAYAQIRNATAEFGPVGNGWGWDIKHFHTLEHTCVVVLRMWHTSEAGVEHSFDSIGQCLLMTRGNNPKVDDDAAKKALTDAITKGLSYLGFNADIFLGQFDDNKYVEWARTETREREQSGLSLADIMAQATRMAQAADSAEALAELREFANEHRARFKPDDRSVIKQLIDMVTKKLSP